MAQHLITRAEWGARYPDGFAPRPLPITEWWLHHSVTIAPDLVPPFSDDDEAVRTLERIGQQRFGGGISYTFPVTPVGRIYQGHSMGRRGAHTLGHNTAGGAFVLVGDYSHTAPTAAQVEAIALRMVIEHRAGRAATHQLNGGHRDTTQTKTECPGDAGEAAIPTINARARALWGATPAPAPAAHGLAVDGWLGANTIRAWQRIMRTTPDGVISSPSELVAEVQRRLNRDERAGLVVDGRGIASNEAGRYPEAGTTHTIRALQRHLGVASDGYLSAPSDTVRALQRRLNGGRF